MKILTSEILQSAPNVVSCNKTLNEAKGKIIVGEMIDDVNCLKSATVYQILIQDLTLFQQLRENG